jgi:inosine-uridine nucleoside N-ribohydrolase
MAALLVSCQSGGIREATVAPEGTRVVVDADTANEIDDLYAIVRALLEPGFRVEGLTSAQWHGRGQGPKDSLDRSQKLNEELLQRLGLESIPHPRGAAEPMADRRTPRDSPAARHIIARARATPEGGKLTVVVLGAFTNLASAILLDPGIVPRLRACVIGLTHDSKGRLGKKEFNASNDPAAVEALLDEEGLDLAVMTATASRPMVFDRMEVDRHLAGKGGVWDFLVGRWAAFAPRQKTWIMWDIALVEALAHPGLATVEELGAPEENARRKVRVWTRIDAAGMKADFWKVIGAKIGRETAPGPCVPE